VRAPLLLLALALAVPAPAQDTPPAPAPVPAATGEEAPVAGPERDDSDIDPADPDFNVITMPAGARIPRGAWAFRLTHRFTRPLGDGDFGDLASDFFGFDSGAQVGFELRYGLRPGLQLGVHRTSDKTIQVFGLYEVMGAGTHPVGVAVLGSIEGLDNLTEEHSPALGVLLSRRLGDRGTVYAMPAFVGNTNLSGDGGDDTTLMLGLGARLRVGRKMAVLAEFTPRLSGHRDRNPVSGEESRHHLAFGLEHRVGGHVFQLNFQDSFGTTPAQIARGGTAGDDWYIGFNLSRRFF
jgi:hypothetical protein